MHLVKEQDYHLSIVESDHLAAINLLKKGVFPRHPDQEMRDPLLLLKFSTWYIMTIKKVDQTVDKLAKFSFTLSVSYRSFFTLDFICNALLANCSNVSFPHRFWLLINPLSLILSLTHTRKKKKHDRMTPVEHFLMDNILKLFRD